MLTAGQVIDNPVLGMRMLIGKTARETGGLAFEADYVLRPGFAPGFPGEHIHPSARESFTILSGSAQYRLDGKTFSAQTGDDFQIAPRSAHIHPWNVGSTELKMRQVTTLPVANSEAIDAAANLFETAFGLARDGKVDPRGFPNLFQLGVCQTAHAPLAYAPGLPFSVQYYLLATFGVIGRALGYRATYPQYGG